MVRRKTQNAKVILHPYAVIPNLFRDLLDGETLNVIHEMLTFVSMTALVYP